ncbi:MAG: hypothetical protein K2F59_02470 [Eubacteriales bacterium]|nr:hypothetical protein [Eubacteriales bacterium]
MSVEERIAKAESLDKDLRDKFLFEYLRLKSLNNGFDENVKWKAFAGFVSYVSENLEINFDNLLNFTDEFEKDYRKNKKFNDDIFYLFIIYVLGI